MNDGATRRVNGRPARANEEGGTMAANPTEDARSQDPVFRIEATRAALRDAAGANDRNRDDRHDRFPRSTLLQVALSPRYRWITAAVAGAAAVALWRRLPGRRVGLLLGAIEVVRRMRNDHR